jgi:hypothetical protein
MDSEARHPDTPSRLRVVDLRIGGERRQLHFGGGFACVVADAKARTAAARWIAKTIVGPPPEGSQVAEIEIEEPVWRLQSPLLPLRAPAVLDRELLQTLWRSDCERRLEVLAGARESALSEQAEISAALDRLRIQPPLTPAAATSGNTSGTPVRSAEVEAELAAFKAAAQRFVRVQSLLATIDALVPTPSPEALELAEEWDAHLAIPPGALPTAVSSTAQPGAAPGSKVAAEPAREATPTPPVPASTAGESDPATDAQRAELERLHRATVRAEARMFRRGLMPRHRAVGKYNEARLREQAALAGAGVDTYAEFLIASNASRRSDEADPAPVDEIASPIDQRDDEQAVLDRPSEDEYAARVARTEELLAHARAILGREPRDDVASELRAYLAEHPERSERVEELAELLREEGIFDHDDVVGRARAFIAAPPSVHIPQPPTWAMRVSRPEVPLGEIEGLENQLAEKDQLIEELAVENIRLVAARESDLLRLGPDDFVRAVGAMVDAYRAGEVLEGHLPLVLDGVLDGLAADARDAAVLALASVDDAQVIVVTADDAVTQRVDAAGGTIVRWPGPEAQRRGPAPDRWSSPRASDSHS